MYNVELWNGCLSFIQMSVALNVGCILVDKNPIERLFDTASSTSQNNSRNYIDEYSQKLNKCTKAVASTIDGNTDAYSKLNKLISSYLKIDKSLKFLKEYSEDVSPICFSYACLLLSIYGLLSLLLIPIVAVAHKSCTAIATVDRAMDMLVLFSIFTALFLIVFLIVEIANRYGGNQLDKSHSTKHLVTFTCIIVAYLLITSIVSYCDYLNLKSIHPYIYDISVILPFLSFIVCFILYLHDRICGIPYKIKVWYYKKKFNKICNEFDL